MRPSPTCLITQAELRDHAQAPHNFETVDCVSRNMSDVDSHFLANLNRMRKDDKGICYIDKFTE